MPRHALIRAPQVAAVLRTIAALCKAVSSKAQYLIITIGTLPYYRFFHQNTLTPILRITESIRRGESEILLVRLLTNWRDRKLNELHYIQVAVGTLFLSTILAAAVIGCFSWQPVSDGYWIGPAMWYATLVLSIFAILLSSSHAFIFSALNSPTLELNSGGDYRRYISMLITHVDFETTNSDQYNGPRIVARPDATPRWIMVFTWQASMMLMAYAVTFFLGGLTVYVCTPLFNGEVKTYGGKISIFYLTVGGITGSIFVCCSFYAYKFIDLDHLVESRNTLQGTALETERVMRLETPAVVFREISQADEMQYQGHE